MGLPQALEIGEDFIAGDPVSLILGGNISHGRGLPGQLRRAAARTDWGTVFACHVNDTECSGIVHFDDGHALAMILKQDEYG